MTNDPSDHVCSAQQRRILFLTPQFPYPPEQGTAIRNYNLIAGVAKRHEVGLLSFYHDAPVQTEHLMDFCRPLKLIGAPRRSMQDRLRTLLTTPDPDMAHRLYLQEYALALQQLLNEQRFDIIQIEGIELAAYALMVRSWLGDRAPAVVLDDHNAEYLLQRRSFETDLRSPRRWPAACYSLLQWERLARFEREACRQADAVVVVSEADGRALQRLNPRLRPLVIANGVDVERYQPDLPDALGLTHPAVVFTGKMDFRPNVDGMLWFHRLVWPLVRAQVPEAHLYVVGKNPHARLTALYSDHSVTMTGYVPDILPYFGGADAYVVPLRIGGGTRLKVLEAMSAGLPLVTTTLGSEGIGLAPGKHALFADSASAFASATVELLRNADLGHSLGTAAREFVLEHYDWRHIVPRLDPLYASL
jgi:glycosyltransferase involved in cell wall biosynthesis